MHGNLPAITESAKKHARPPAPESIFFAKSSPTTTSQDIRTAMVPSTHCPGSGNPFGIGERPSQNTAVVGLVYEVEPAFELEV